MKIRVLIYCLVVILPAVLAACNGRAYAVKSVYATAYTILTQTAIAVAKIPTNTPVPTQVTATTLATLAISLTPTATPTSVPTAQLVTPTVQSANNPAPQPTPRPATPTQALLIIPTNPLSVPTSPSSTLTATTPPPTSTPGIQPPQQGLVGIWQEDQLGTTFQFDADGTYRLANSYRGMMDDFIDDGEYTLQGNQVTLAGGNSSVACKGITGVYNLQIPIVSQRYFNLGQDVCFDRQRVVPGKIWYWLPVSPGATPVATTAVEQPIVPIPLQGSLTSPTAKVSGLTWYNDNLIFLPQSPSFVGDGKSYLFALPRADLVSYLNNSNAGPLTPLSILFNDSGISNQLVGFQGYQAAAINGDKIFLVAQADPGGGPRSYLVAGNIATDLASITLDLGKIVEIPASTVSSSKLYRSLLVSEGILLAIPELNGATTNPNPVVQRFDSSLNNQGTLPLAGIEYLVTDSTAPDTNGRIWVLNKFAPGDPGALPGLDPLAQLYGEGITHHVFDYTERLVSYQLSSTGINLAAVPPIQLELSAQGPRNWQGLAALGSQGYLLVTSQSPGTILGYIPTP